jgi:DNA-binding NtrC family response regulator
MPSNGSTRATILFADDERALTTLFAAHLRRANFDVKIALDGAEARDAFLLDPASFDLLITDSSMPNLSGIELGEIVAQQGCPVLLTSGADSPEAAQHGWRFLEKPFSADQLVRAVEEVLQRAEESRERARPA